MTDIFALDPGGQAELERTARANPVGLEALNQATPFEGAMLGIGDGLMRGGARVAQTAGLAVAAPFAVYERATGEEGRFTDSIFRAVDEYATNAVDYWTPSAAEVGKAGQILGGLAEIAAPLMLGGGNPSLLIATQTTSPAVDLVREGVSAPVAAAVGALQGASTAVGFRLPILGSTLASRLATGAAGNLALGVSTVAAQRAVLEASGTPATQQVAERYDPLNAESAALDVLTGLVFGGLTHVHVTAAQREAVLTALNAKHFQSDTAPGQPGDMASFVAHQRAMEQATEQLVRGEPVTPSTAITEASFQPRATPDPEATLASLREVLPENERAVTEIAPRSEPGTPESADATNFGLAEPPRSLPDNHPLLQPRHADNSPERTALRDSIVRRSLADAIPVEGRKPIAYVMAGGGASGKGTLLARLKNEGSIPEHGAVEIDPDAIKEQLPEYKQIIAKRDSRAAATVHEESSAVAKQLLAAAMKKRADIVFDRTMSDRITAPAEIQALKDDGYMVKLRGVTVAPESAISRAVTRAQKRFRYVPLPALLKAHKGFAQIFERLAGMADDAVLYDNEVPAGTAPRILATKGRDGSLTVLDRKGYNAFRERGALNEQATTYRELAPRREASATSTDDARGGGQANLGLHPGADARSDGGSGQPLREAAVPGGLPGQGIDAAAITDPDVRAAHEAVATRDFEIPTGETGPDGQPVTVSARQLLSDAAAAVERAKADAPAFQAAVNCLLRGGA